MPSVAEDAWGSLGDLSPTLQRVLGDAERSRLLTGETPDSWSPLGTVGAGELGRLTEFEAIVDEWASARDLSAGEGTASQLAALNGGPELVGARLVVRGETVGALLFWPDRVVIPLAERMQGVEVSFTPETDREFSLWGQAQVCLQQHVPQASVRSGLLWRCSYGGNSTDGDGAADAPPGTPIGIATYGAGFAVARVFTWVGTSRTRRDPTAARRLLREEAHEEHISDICPRIPVRPMRAPVVVIAVHGTMATSVPLAREINAAIGAAAPIVRFEHDTWLPINANANELAHDIARLDCQKTILVAHSRGGLVARQAAYQAQAPSRSIRVLTMGTPFHGTNMVKTARGALIGFTSASGALAGHLGRPVVSVLSRLGGLMFTLPDGISCMDPDDRYMQGLWAFPPPPVDIAFGGDTHLLGPGHQWTFASGATTGIFRGKAHDLVVPADSAIAGSPNTAVLPCDHFNYPHQQDVRTAINNLI